jgi:hypothetical protein
MTEALRKLAKRLEDEMPQDVELLTPRQIINYVVYCIEAEIEQQTGTGHKCRFCSISFPNVMELESHQSVIHGIRRRGSTTKANQA